MAEYGTRIAAAIDALKIKYDLVPIMMTCTVPHKNWMNINDVYDILQKTWRTFSHTKRSSTQKKYTLKKTIGEDKRAKGKAGEVKTYEIKTTRIFPQMCATFQIKHTVRVYEFTWGENGWHPHIHSLLWVPKKYLDKLNDGWEQKLADDWWEIAEHKAKEIYAKKFPDDPERINQAIEAVFNETSKKHNSIHISKDRNHKIKVMQSSHYISGWGGDLEVSNEKKLKRASDGHYSPLQILEEAYKQRHKKDPDEKWINLYIEYLKATYGKRRVQFSRTGLNAIIAEWFTTNKWVEVLKKKYTEKATANWKTVCWFSNEQWRQISFYHLQTKLLDLSLLTDAHDEIKKFLLQYDIKLSDKKHWFEKFLENTTFLDALNNQATNLKKRAAKECA